MSSWYEPGPRPERRLPDALVRALWRLRGAVSR